MPELIELIQEEIKELEENLYRIEVRKSKYVLSTDIPLSLEREEEQLKEKLEQRRARLKLEKEKSSIDVGIDPLTIEQNIKNIHVNREEEIALFREMVEGRSNIDILLIEAESGMGKSALLKKFKVMSDELQLPWAKIDFRKASYTFGEIFREMCDQLGEISFSNFDDKCRRFISSSGLTVGHSTFISSSIDSAMSKYNDDERNTERQVIIDAFFGDLAIFNEKYQRTIILTFDTFERASPKVKDWITEQLISRSRHVHGLICVVAGQETPGIDPTSEWALHSKLEALRQEHIAEYLHRLKLTQEDVIVKFITSVLDKDSSEMKSIKEEDLIKMFTRFISFSTDGIPADLQKLALKMATQDR